MRPNLLAQICSQNHQTFPHLFKSVDVFKREADTFFTDQKIVPSSSMMLSNGADVRGRIIYSSSCFHMFPAVYLIQVKTDHLAGLQDPRNELQFSSRGRTLDSEWRKSPCNL